MLAPHTNIHSDARPFCTEQTELAEEKEAIKLQERSSDDSDDDISLDSEFSSDKNIEVTRIQSKSFPGVPSEWHETIQVRHVTKQRVKLYFRCRHEGCKSMFKKSCNLRDHFRKHTG